MLEELETDLPNTVENLANSQVRHALRRGIDDETDSDGDDRDTNGFETSVHISSLCQKGFDCSIPYLCQREFSPYRGS